MDIGGLFKAANADINAAPIFTEYEKQQAGIINKNAETILALQKENADLKESFNAKCQSYNDVADKYSKLVSKIRELL